jgi:hypothetical protein
MLLKKPTGGIIGVTIKHIRLYRTRGVRRMTKFAWFMKRPSNIEKDALVDGETSDEEDDDGLNENHPS